MSRTLSLLRTAGLSLLVLLIAEVVVSWAQRGPEWIQVEGPKGTPLRAAVFRPAGGGPFPVLVILHGGSGLGQGYVDWARDLAREGFIALAGCWFGRGEDRIGGVDPCPATTARGDASVAHVAALMTAGWRLSGACEQVGLIGHSLGAAAALTAASSGIDVRAVTAVAGVYTTSRMDIFPPMFTVENLAAAVLLLHGNQDGTVPVREAVAYETRARELGKNVQSFYYPEGRHDLPFAPAIRADVLRRSVDFFRQHLR